VQLDPYHFIGTTIPELGLGGSIVVKICRVLPSENYVVYFDNFFTSLRLLQRLSASGIKVQCVSIALKTALSAVEKVKKMARGTYDHRLDSNSNIVVVRWHDNRWTLKTVACVVDATDISPELQMVQWSMQCPISLAVYDPCILHGYVQQVSKQRRLPRAGPNGYPVGGDVLIQAVDSVHVLFVLGDHVWLRDVNPTLLGTGPTLS